MSILDQAVQDFAAKVAANPKRSFLLVVSLAALAGASMGALTAAHRENCTHRKFMKELDEKLTDMEQDFGK